MFTPRANFTGEREKNPNDLIESILSKHDADLYKEEQTGKSVFIINFHFALLLVDDSEDSYPTAGTIGTTFSWGSFEDNQLIKTGGSTKLKAYNFRREMEYGNTYEWVGRTKAPPEYIELVAKFITNNQWREERKNRNALNILKGLGQISSLGRAAGAGI
ncbi:hypothetical protein J7337_013014 [Fusarium musae]|uniref:Uncharacterized protein n=1 Tax=Fusarium musae TaxID=1042133 RepID=A0A9P8D708_9HYPO|nr:hypothetical protein J7337_013014 [Fusarium musae]KAG9496426.1 hypothetical protein J7337_013014 [Fusarium musae]